MKKVNITNISLSSKYTDKQKMMTDLAKENFCINEALKDCDPKLVNCADSMVLSAIDAKVKTNQSLLLEEAFSGMLLVLAATNNLIRARLFPKMDFSEAIAKGVGFLQLMATKEAIQGLSPEEIAGMVAAANLDLVFRPKVSQVAETCGMGGDRGWSTKRVKTISASTLSALVLASLDIPTFKHGSYGNTTKVGSTDVPINFGAQACHHAADTILRLFAETNFWFSDAHSVKTIHYLSHLLMVETVNHIIGPMTVPIAKETELFKVMGVNHHVNPETIARAYTILHERKFINLGSAAIVCGLDELPQGKEYNDPRWVAKHSFLDEVSPRATLVSLAKSDRFLGNFVLTHEDFGADPLDEETLKIQNTIPTLMTANQKALQGLDGNLSSYLAQNAALGLLVSKGLNEASPLVRIPQYYRECLETIESGKAFQKLQQYVEVSGGNFRNWLKRKEKA
ncbi:MAG: hypothetical protein ACE5J0_02475 [Candidatus Paceibacterales bacterium]